MQGAVGQQRRRESVRHRRAGWMSSLGHAQDARTAYAGIISVAAHQIRLHHIVDGRGAREQRADGHHVALGDVGVAHAGCAASECGSWHHLTAERPGWAGSVLLLLGRGAPCAKRWRTGRGATSKCGEAGIDGTGVMLNSFQTSGMRQTGLRVELEGSPRRAEYTSTKTWHTYTPCGSQPRCTWVEDKAHALFRPWPSTDGTRRLICILQAASTRCLSCGRLQQAGDLKKCCTAVNLLHCRRYTRRTHMRLAASAH